MLSINNIVVQAGQKKLLDDVTATFETGKVNLIIGPNGAGKSTMIGVVSGQIKPDHGKVLYDQVDLSSLPREEISRRRAVLLQNTQVVFPLKVWEVVMMSRYPHFILKPGASDEQAVEETMRLFDVWELKERDYLTLSGGEKQRVHFARVFSQIWFPLEEQFSYLILDEPLTFLDVYYQFEFMNRLRSILQDRRLIVVMVVHDLNLAARFGDRILLLKEGRRLAEGTKEQVLTQKLISEAFQLKPSIHYRGNGSFNLFFE